jgi:hypothetical protein
MRDREGLPTTAAGGPGQADRHRRDWFFLNLIWLIVLGVAVLFWISLFTNWLAVVIAALGFGGVLAWIPFLGHLIGEDRKKQSQRCFESFLKSRITSLGLIAVTVALVVVGSNLGCFVIDARADDATRKLVIRRSDPSQHQQGPVRLSARVHHVASRSVSNFLVWTGVWGRRYEIDADGLPLIQRVVCPWRRQHLTTPADFLWQSVILVRADPSFSQTSANPLMDYTATIQLTGQDAKEVDFDGRALWIGCREGVTVPAPLQEKWRYELVSWLAAQQSNLPSSCVEPILALWLAPATVGGVSELKPGQQLTITVHAKGRKSSLAEGSAVIRPCLSAEDFPQVIYLKSVSNP